MHRDRAADMAKADYFFSALSFYSLCEVFFLSLEWFVCGVDSNPLEFAAELLFAGLLVVSMVLVIRDQTVNDNEWYLMFAVFISAITCGVFVLTSISGTCPDIDRATGDVDYMLEKLKVNVFDLKPSFATRATAPKAALHFYDPHKYCNLAWLIENDSKLDTAPSFDACPLQTNTFVSSWMWSVLIKFTLLAAYFIYRLWPGKVNRATVHPADKEEQIASGKSVRDTAAVLQPDSVPLLRQRSGRRIDIVF